MSRISRRASSGGGRPTARHAISGAWALLALLAAPAIADDDPLVADRPYFTESAATVTRGRTQIELGYTHTEIGDLEEQAIGELLMRIGWTEIVELRLGLNSWLRVDGPGGDLSGLQDLSLGCKIRLSDPLPPGSRLPQVALVFATTLPTGSNEFGNSEPQPAATLALSWALSDRTSVGSNVGYARMGERNDRFGEISASVVLGHALSEDLGGFVEVYALSRQEAARLSRRRRARLGQRRLLCRRRCRRPFLKRPA
jgi:hypothetical protein